MASSEGYTDIKFEIKGKIGIIKVHLHNTTIPLPSPHVSNSRIYSYLQHSLTIPSSTAPKLSTPSAETSLQTPSQHSEFSTATPTLSSPF